MFNIAFRMTGDYEKADEVAHEAFFPALGRSKRFVAKQPLPPE